NTECGTRDEYNRMREMLEPGLFSDLCSAQVTENISAAKPEKQTGEPAEVEFPDGTRAKINGKLFRLKPGEAKSAAVFTSGRLKGSPAVTIRSYGKGYAVLYATDGNDVYFYEALAKLIKDEFSIKPLVEADDGIIVSSRLCEDKEYIFAVNMKDRPVSIRLENEMKDELTGKTLGGSVMLDGYDVLMLEKKI
ncbi:MAG: beta-galactosidase trimerization domain-containing protein, partial [Oscillospiraceae bacterium]|nr:beta-galactosidase trimerization domain-containing protein [Oscillospiraceae bacterium]